MELFDGWYINLAERNKTRFRIHLLAPFGLAILTGLTLSSGKWAALLILILAHELGHALLAARFGAQVVSIDITPLGGECRFEDTLDEFEHSVVAWGGVLAQGVLLLGTLGLTKIFGHPHHQFGDDVAYILIVTNLILVVINLLPIEPLDGYFAWRLPYYLISDRMSRPRRNKDAKVKDPVLAMEKVIRISNRRPPRRR